MQAKAVNEFNRNVLLLARAGTGKTYTVAQKIVKAEQLGIEADKILCLTFTVKAAEEMRNDILAYCGDYRPEVFTIHGFCYRLMREYGRKTGKFSDKQIADEIDDGEMIKSILNEYISSGEYKTADGVVPVQTKNLVKAVSMIKHRRAEMGYNYFSAGGYGAAIDSLFSSSEEFKSCFTVKIKSVKYEDENLISLLKRKGSEFMEKYRFNLNASALCDFDDLIFSAKEIISDIKYQKPAYKLIIVDEMQDTSFFEYEIMKAFFSGANVMLCGDQFQTIYGWRGSKPFEIIEDFKKEYAPLVVNLDKNRRSSEVLSYVSSYYLNAAFNAGIDVSEPQNFSEKDMIKIIPCNGAEGEAKAVFDEIKAFDGERKDVCVMARSNRYIADLYRELQKINAELPASDKIDFFTADTHFQFYKKPLIKDYLAFLRLLINPDDEASFLRVAGKCVDGVTGEMIAAINDYSSLGLSVGQFLSDSVYLFGDYYSPLLKAFSRGKVVVYDLETTGLDLDDDQAIQISAVKTGKNGVTETFNRFVIPTIPIKQSALSVHGYDENYVLKHGGAPAGEVLRDFCEFAKGCVLVGHNSSSFDDVILERELGENSVQNEFKYRFDTLKIASLLKPQTGDYKLSTLCEAFGIVNERAHDAFSDVTATESVLRVFIDKFIAPTSSSREKVTNRFSVVFKDFYELLKNLKEMLLKGDLLSLVKTLGSILGVNKEKNDLTDKESTNDFYRALKGYAGKSEPISSLKAFLQDVSLSGSQMDVLVKKFNKVPLVTIHQSKGCEFKKVIIAGAGENEFPSFGAVASGNEEEEKRVFYVALTRAKEELTITYPCYKTFYDVSYRRAPSPYLSYLPKKFVRQ
mgnify:CR=1 FL=1